MNLAELNIGRFRYPADDPRMAGFMDNLDRVNAVAERSDGFIWRLKDESGNATAIRPFPDPNMAVNLSVWRDAQSLKHYVWNTVHKQFYARRNDWFELMESHHFVMWWIDEGHLPTPEEAKERLDHLHQNGDSDFAFGWSHLPHIKLWQQARCA
ncbi:MAG: DUF3291 domain-containing protein [Mesorhizobium sp.]|nr:DUF3291 domain-containing protein [Mesorhizobium sp.]